MKLIFEELQHRNFCIVLSLRSAKKFAQNSISARKFCKDGQKFACFEFSFTYWLILLHNNTTICKKISNGSLVRCIWWAKLEKNSWPCFLITKSKTYSPVSLSGGEWWGGCGDWGVGVWILYRIGGPAITEELHQDKGQDKARALLKILLFQWSLKKP